MIPTLNSATAGSGLPLADYVSLAKNNGFSAVEFSILEAAEIADKQDFEAAAAIFDLHKVLPICFGLPVEWRGNEVQFQEGLKALPQLTKLAQDLGCSRCTTWVLPEQANRCRSTPSAASRAFVKLP